jgi:hypothetical protein
MKKLILLLCILLCSLPIKLVAQCNNTGPIGWWYECYCKDSSGNWTWSGNFYLPEARCLAFQHGYNCFEFVMLPVKCGTSPMGYGDCEAWIDYKFWVQCVDDKSGCDPDILEMVRKYTDASGKVNLSRFILKIADLHTLPLIERINPETGKLGYEATYNLFKVIIDASGSLIDIKYVPQKNDTPEYAEASINLVKKEWKFMPTGEQYKILIRVVNIPLIESKYGNR